jgi:photosystem II stability/assembly factor-like uncharacterized protein
MVHAILFSVFYSFIVLHYQGFMKSKLIVTNVNENGDFGPGEFSVSISGLAINGHYDGRAHATNGRGTGYGVRADWWTLANIPGKPLLNNFTGNSVDVTPDVNSNPAITQFAVRVAYVDTSNTIVEKYVNAAGGNLQNEADWQINANWGTKTISGLNTEIEYSVSVKARNGENVETDFSDTANVLLTDVPDVVSGGELVWNETSPPGQVSKDWMCSAISGDGNTLLAGVYKGRLYLSRDRGISWAEIRPGGDADLTWYSLSISEDGSVMMAGVNGKRLYISLDGGINWSETRPIGDDDGGWHSVSVSADGSVMWTCDRYLYRSTDHGANWTEVKPLGDTQKGWILTAVSQNGSKVAAAHNDKEGFLYLSDNGGTTFTTIQPAGNLLKVWSSLSMSADGNTMLLSADQGRLYITTDGGIIWNETQPAGANDKFWFSTSVSYDGQTILAGVLTERLYLSTDGGISWSETQPAGDNNL